MARQAEGAEIVFCQEANVLIGQIFFSSPLTNTSLFNSRSIGIVLSACLYMDREEVLGLGGDGSGG